MKFSIAAAVTSFAALAAARPAVRLSKRADETGYTGAAYTGTLVTPSVGDSFPLGQNITFSYDSTPRGAGEPHFGSSTVDVNIGLQGPSPIVVANDFQPWGILELANGLDVGGPGGWVNTSLSIPSTIYKGGEYFLIVTERQRPTYDSEQPTFRVESYNVSITLTEAESSK
ncbi:hypothetical protein JCM6882_004174 [Rhodosporidiobolus microsporus]